MNKNELEQLRNAAWEARRNVTEAVKSLTAENPLILYDKEKLDGGDDEFYELPYAYYVDKHFYYIEGRIVEVKGDDVLVIFSGEDFGEEHETTLNDIPYESLVDLLDYLIERK